MEKTPEDLTKINEIIKNSFGKKFRISYDCSKKKNAGLPEIILGMGFPIPGLFEFGFKKGEFTSEDCSKLLVQSKYIPHAQRYSEMYKNQFDKEVFIQTYSN